MHTACHAHHQHNAQDLYIIWKDVARKAIPPSCVICTNGMLNGLYGSQDEHAAGESVANVI